MQKMEILRKLVVLVKGAGTVFSITYRDHSQEPEPLDRWELVGPNAAPRIFASSFDALLDAAIVEFTKDAELGIASRRAAISNYEQLRCELPRLEIAALKDILMWPAGTP